MAQTLEVIDVPTIRPPGVTKRQWRLAALLPRCATAAEALRQAGYAPSSIDKASRPLTGTLGVRRATEALQEIRADRARGIMGLSQRALEAGSKKLDELDARDQLAFGLKAAEIAANLGENVETSGNADRWRQRIRRACRLMARLTEARLRAPQDVVLSPDVIETDQK